MEELEERKRRRRGNRLESVLEKGFISVTKLQKENHISEKILYKYLLSKRFLSIGNKFIRFLLFWKKVGAFPMI